MKWAKAPSPDNSPDHLSFTALFGGQKSKMWWPLVIGVGITSGIASAGYVELLKQTTKVLGPNGFANWTHLVILTAVGLAIALLVRFLGSPGDVELLVDNIHVGGRPADLRALRTLIPVSILGIAAGSAIGPEAPLVQTTGTIGNWIAGKAKVDEFDARILAITGMASGFTVLFGAPLGASLFALEILHRRGLEYYEALLPAVIGALSGWAVFAVLMRSGFHPVWQFPFVSSITFVDVGIGVAAGVAGAAIAIGFSWSVAGMRWSFSHLPGLSRPVVGGLVLGGLAFLSPYALTFAEPQLQHVAMFKVAVTTLGLALICKFLATSAVVAAGWRGGFIIPLFFMGATVGAISSHLIGGHETVMIVSMMVATNVGVTKTPFGSTVVVAEMAGMKLLPPALIAAVISMFLTSRVSLIHTQRSRSRPVTDTRPVADTH
jgi:H+/Cl- antiporter ClcA